MGFKVGADRMIAGSLAADITDTRQLLAHRFSLRILRGIDCFQREYSGKDPRPHHDRHKTRAFFIGPEHHFNRRFGFNIEVVQRTHHLQRRQHP